MGMSLDRKSSFIKSAKLARPGVLKVGKLEKSMPCEGEEKWPSESMALSCRVNGVSGAMVAARVPRGVRIFREGVIRDGVMSRSAVSAPRRGVNGLRWRDPGVGVLSKS